MPYSIVIKSIRDRCCRRATQAVAIALCFLQNMYEPRILFSAISPEAPVNLEINIEGPDEEPIAVKRPQTIHFIPDQLVAFINYKLVPRESFYFQSGIGIDPLTGMPYDHIRLRLDKHILGERGNYTAASKLSLLIPYLLGILQQKPVFAQVHLKPPDAEKILYTSLTTLLKYIKEYPDYGGFLPWVDIRPNGTIAPSNTKIPSLDNGQLSWALAAVVSALENSPNNSYKEMAEMAQKILNAQNYAQFYNSQKKMLYGTIQKDFHKDGVWTGDESYYLDDMCEGTLAVLWAVLHGQISEEAWYNLKIPTVDYVASSGEKITTLRGFRGSFHEQWALGFLPFMESDLAPLYLNYLLAQADFARSHKMPGFVSTAYDAKGTYRQMGVPGLSSNPVDRSDVAVVFATAMGMLIFPALGAEWTKRIYEFKQVATRFGAVESIGEDGYADIMTADAKGMTMLAISGGVTKEVKEYLFSHLVPKTKISMYVKFMELLHAKYKQIMTERGGKPVYFPRILPLPIPPEQMMDVKIQQQPRDPGAVYIISDHLQKGHLHGKNVRSQSKKTLEDDIRPRNVFKFEFEIPAYYPYFNQWAFRGTYIDETVGIGKMKYLSVDVPAKSPAFLYEIELKSDDIVLASIVIDTDEEGILSLDGQWKTIIKRFEITPEAPSKHFNYMSVAIHDPRYLYGKYTAYGRQGGIALKNIRLLQRHPFTVEQLDASKSALSGFDILRYWRRLHGDIPIPGKNAGVLHFRGRRGWKGGYLPFIDLDQYKYLYLKIRNLQKSTLFLNRIYVELKNENEYLAGYKIPINLKSDAKIRYYKIELPQGKKPLNYFAISNPRGDFELFEAVLSPEYKENFDVEVITVPLNPEMEKFPWFDRD